jgi:DNA-3-methyladenine glycosylase I
MSSYCEAIRSGKLHPVHTAYHDTQYGFPIPGDNELFERLVLEINQAGLSWETILKKQETFRTAYRGFDVAKVARFGDRDRGRLLADPGIIRNRLKVEAAIHNAGVILALCKSHGSFQKWLDSHHPQSRDAWTRLFKKTFRFTGGEIVNEFLISTGYLPGAHVDGCPVLKKVLKASPPWNRNIKA